MDGAEIVKAVPGIAKGVAEIIAAVPIADIVKRICGPTADLFGEKAKQRVERCFEKTARMTQDAGFTPQAVPPKLLVPILQEASLEDDEDLHTMWAALLANAASPNGNERVRVGFVAVLQQLSRDEALLLNWIFDQPKNESGSGEPVTVANLHFAYAELGFGSVHGDDSLWRADVDELEFEMCLSGLESAKLISQGENTYALTRRGYQFVSACRAPSGQPSVSRSIQAIRC